MDGAATEEGVYLDRHFLHELQGNMMRLGAVTSILREAM